MATFIERIASFKNISSQTTSLSKLVNEGIYCRDDEVLQCYECGFTSNKDELDTVSDMHREQCPSCPFITGHRPSKYTSASHQLQARKWISVKRDGTSSATNNTNVRGEDSYLFPSLQADGGKNFGTGTSQHRRNLNLETDSAYPGNNGYMGRTTNSATAQGNSSHIDKRIIKSRMDTPIVQKIIQLGYPAELIQKALEQRFVAEGDDFSNATDLLKAVLDLQSQQETVGSTSSSHSNHRDVVDAVQPQQSGRSTMQPLEPRNFSESNISVTPVSVLTKQQKDDEKNESLAGDTTQKSRKETEDEINKMIEENDRMRTLRTCKICLDSFVDTVFLPCAHFSSCYDCATKLRSCPLCRTIIRKLHKANVGWIE